MLIVIAGSDPQSVFFAIGGVRFFAWLVFATNQFFLGTSFDLLSTIFGWWHPQWGTTNLCQT